MGKQWRCSVLLCMPAFMSAAYDLLHTETAVLLLWQQVVAPASRVSTSCLEGFWHSNITRTATWSGLPTRYGTITLPAAIMPAARQEEQCWTRQRRFGVQVCLMQQACSVWPQGTACYMLLTLSAATTMCALVVQSTRQCQML